MGLAVVDIVLDSEGGNETDVAYSLCAVGAS